MSFSYNPDLTVALNYLRWRIDDTEEDYAEFDDEVLQFFIDEVSGTPSTQDLDKIALRLLKKQLQEILRGPSRERSGAYEVYGPTAQSLEAAIAQLEKEISSNSPPTMYAGGVKIEDVCRNRNDNTLTQTVFDKDEFFNKECYTRNDSGFIGGN